MPASPLDSAIFGELMGDAEVARLKLAAMGIDIDSLTAEQAAYLREEGCEYLQGFHFSRPVPPQQIERILQSGFVGD